MFAIVAEGHWQCIRVYVRRWRQCGGGPSVFRNGKLVGVATEHTGKLGTQPARPKTHSYYHTFCIGFYRFVDLHIIPMIIAY